ncbi:MAG: ABC transporter permease [Actinomycetes bacterium]
MASTTQVAVPTPHQLAWKRRRNNLVTNWALFRGHGQAMVGLFILLAAVALAVVGPWVVSPDAIDPATATGIPNHAPYSGYPLGTDNFGRSVLDLLVMGARVSLVVGLAATVGAVVVGAAVGLLSGYYGGSRLDTVLSALTNFFLVIPWLVLAIALATILGPTLWNVILVIAVTSWAITARLVRSQVLSIRRLPYVERARVLGASDWTIITRYVLPNVFPVIFANAVLTVAIAILSETTLAILGLGDPNSISWGRIIEEAFNAGAMANGYWWWMIPPGVAIVLVTLAFTMCGHAIDEIVNPKLRRR